MRKTTTTIIITLLFVVVLSNIAGAQITWTWDSGTYEGWFNFFDTYLTIENGRNGTYGLGLSEDLVEIPYARNRDYLINPFSVIEIYVDINREMAGPGNSLWIRISANDTSARFYTDPSNNIGSIVPLGDGWYRHYLEFTTSDTSFGGADEVLLVWDWAYNAPPSNPVIFDNLTITVVPEPISSILFVTGGATLVGRRYLKRRKKK